MSRKKTNEQRILEIALILICVALCGLLYRVGPYRMVVLNLFYLPVVLAAFFLGRYLAGVLALLCVVCAAVVTALDLGTLVAYTSPLAVGLALTIWAAVMGINSILVGTLSDERVGKIEELHDAYLGVVEVLVQYLNSADPRSCDRARKTAEISQQVAARMRFSDKEIDNIRVAALLQDMEHIEVTARVIRKAVGDVAQAQRGKHLEHTFHGSDLVQSIGSVLTGALPLLESHDGDLDPGSGDARRASAARPAQRAQIIRTVRSYLTLLTQDPASPNPAMRSRRLRTAPTAIILRLSSRRWNKSCSSRRTRRKNCKPAPSEGGQTIVLAPAVPSNFISAGRSSSDTSREGSARTPAK